MILADCLKMQSNVRGAFQGVESSLAKGWLPTASLICVETTSCPGWISTRSFERDPWLLVWPCQSCGHLTRLEDIIRFNLPKTLNSLKFCSCLSRPITRTVYQKQSWGAWVLSWKGDFCLYRCHKCHILYRFQYILQYVRQEAHAVVSVKALGDKLDEGWRSNSWDSRFTSVQSYVQKTLGGWAAVIHCSSKK